MSAASPEAREMSVRDFLSRVETGYFAGRRVELIDGWVTTGKRHSPLTACVACMIDEWMIRHIPDDMSSWIRGLLEFRQSCPQPDHAVIQGDLRGFRDHFPNSSETLLVIESSGVTLLFDRTVKGPIYADAGVQEYWILNCEERQVEVYTDPHSNAKSPQYRMLTTYLPGQAVPLHIAGKKLGELAVKDLFPEKK